MIKISRLESLAVGADEIQLSLGDYKQLHREKSLNHRNFDIEVTIPLLKQKILGYLLPYGTLVRADLERAPGTFCVVKNKSKKSYDF